MARWRSSTWTAHVSVAVAALCFGSTFLPVQDAIRHAGPVPFLAVRFCAGAAMLIPFALRRPLPEPRSILLREGLRCGVPLLAGYVLQTWGLRYTTTSASAFITYMLVVMVPLLTAMSSRRLPSPVVMAGVGLAAGGLYLLTGSGVRGFGLGEALTLGCAFAFALNIIAIGRAVASVDAVWLALAQLAVVGIGCSVPGAFAGGYRLPAATIGAAIYTAAIASALAFGLQIWGQRLVGPTRTSLLLMLEPVTAALIGRFAAGERLGAGGAAGAVLILVGIALSEAPILTAESRETMLAPAPGGGEHRRQVQDNL
jgi:drug/metabolite transporter (DMT)-like permease